MIPQASWPVEKVGYEKKEKILKMVQATENNIVCDVARRK